MAFASGKYTLFCEWRTAWITYLDRQPYADDKLTAFLRKYPTSARHPRRALLARPQCRRSGNPAARAPTSASTPTASRKPILAAPPPPVSTRWLQAPKNMPDFLTAIPPAPALRATDEPVPDAAKDRWVRAQALRVIAFDASARTRTQICLLRHRLSAPASRSRSAPWIKATQQRACPTAASSCPISFAEKFPTCTTTFGRRSTPLPSRTLAPPRSLAQRIRSMLAAGLIRQESTFQADIVSHANAIGLMQVLPKTVDPRKAAQSPLRKNETLRAQYNIELGMLYIASSPRDRRSEYALAAFNAGEDRIATWRRPEKLSSKKSRASRIHPLHRDPRLRPDRNAQRRSLPPDLQQSAA